MQGYQLWSVKLNISKGLLVIISQLKKREKKSLNKIPKFLRDLNKDNKNSSRIGNPINRELKFILIVSPMRKQED